MEKSRRRGRALAGIAAAAIVFPCAAASAQPARANDTAATEVEVLRSEVQQLRSEVDRLEAEVHKLSRALKQQGADSAGLVASKDTTNERRAVSEKKYWLTTSSRTRHNSSCRYYKTTAGRPCGPKEGSPCKRCGG
ncbi:MAG: hypothetical protein JW768_04420 [Chitinispirillaceae bacterium]|nr:hypothetical protein [Chitinispirillaceae bacterium]